MRMQTIRLRTRAMLVALFVALAALVGPCLPAEVAAASSGSQAMWRLYNPNTGEHFYTAHTYERDHLAQVGWRKEGQGWVAPTKSSTPVYRLYNPVIKGGDHHYTMNSNERDMLIKAGWRYEGVGWYSDDAKGIALWRQYNPNAATGTHNYTVNTNERDMLIRAGWRNEGVAWYGLAAGGSSGSATTKPAGGTGSSGGSTSTSKPSGGSGSGSTTPQTTSYTVTFNAQGGSTVASQKVAKGAKATKPANPTRSGYAFSGWYTASGAAYNFNTAVTSNITLYAHWNRVAQYSYQAYYLDGQGDTWYDGSPRVLYIKTNNPDASFSLHDKQATQTYEHVNGSGSFADVKDKGQVANFLKVDGGYLVEYSFDTTSFGAHTIEIVESNPDAYWDTVVATTFTAQFKSYDATVNAWIDGYISRYTTSSMTPVDKMRSISNALLNDFTYLLNDGGYLVNLVTEPSPYFLSYHWDSYVSPAVLCQIAERVGGFSDIHNCYGDYPYGSEGWQGTHWYCRCTYQGEDYYFEACPLTPTGQIDRDSIAKINFSALSGAPFDAVAS